MTKNIITLTTYDSIGNPYYNGGGAKAVHEIATHLAKYYRVNIICGYYPGAKDRRINGVYYKYIGVANPILGQLTFSLLHAKHAIRTNPALIIESFTPPFSVSLLPILSRVPVVGLVHMLSARDMERKYHLPFTWVENIGLKWYKNFIVLSEYWHSVIRTINNSANFAVIPNAVALPRVSSIKKNYYLFLGRIEIDQKGLDLLIDSWDLLDKPYKLIIAGGGSLSEIARVKAKILSSKNSAYIEYVGHVEGQAKDKLLSQAMATLIPSRYETFSMTALESLAYGTPIICFDIAGMDWISPNSVLRAKAFSPKSFADQVSKFNSSQALTKRMRSSAMLERKKYNFKQVLKKYVSLIEDLT